MQQQSQSSVNRLSQIRQNFSVPYEYPVYFTRNLFSPANDTMIRSIASGENTTHHKTLFFVEQSVNAAFPDLRASILHYCESHREQCNLIAPPLVRKGGESSKGIDNLEFFWEILDRYHLCRQSFVCIIGGGAFLDTVCLAASMFHRGIRQVRIPTTVMAQCDSGVGVKNAVNYLNRKNLLGTFFPPFAVINDFDFLTSLGDRDWLAGIAEAFKVALIKDAGFFHWLCKNIMKLKGRDGNAMEYLVKHSARLHLEHIAQSGDPFEFGSSRPLDFGHWLAHKLEMTSKEQVRHGEAVAIGVVVDSYYALKTGNLDQQTFQHLLDAFRQLGFDLYNDRLSRFADAEVIDEALEDFREHLGGKLHITIPDGLGRKQEIHALDKPLVMQAIGFLTTGRQ